MDAKKEFNLGKNVLRHAICAALAAPLLSPALAVAASSDAELQELKAMIETLQKKVNSLEQSQAKSAGTASAAPAASGGNLLPKGVKIYGSLDSGVERVSNVGAAKESVSRIPSTTGYGPSVLGFDFRGNMTDSLAAVGKAEMGLYVDTGSSGQGSRIFGRQLYIGVDSPLGSVTFGRQYSMLFYGLQGSDILGPNIYGLGSIDAYIPNARADNSVVWRGKFDKWSLGAHYSFGRDTINSVPASGTCAGEDVTGTSRCRGWSAMAKFDDQRFGGAVAIDNQYGGTGSQASFFNGAAPLAMASSGDLDRRITANGYARFGAFKLGAGWLGRKVETAATSVKQNTTWLEGEYTISPKFVVDGGIFHVTNDQQNRSANLYALRGTYKIDEQLSTYLTLGYMDNSDTAGYGVSGGGAGTAPAVGNSQLGTMVGVRYKF